MSIRKAISYGQIILNPLFFSYFFPAAILSTETKASGITPVHTNLPTDLPGLSPVHESIVREGKSVFVLPGDEVVVHPKRGFLVLNRHFTPWEKIDSPDPFFNLPADGYNSGRFVIGLAMERERERRYREFAASGLGPRPKLELKSSFSKSSQTLLPEAPVTTCQESGGDTLLKTRPSHTQKKSSAKSTSRTKKTRARKRKRQADAVSNPDEEGDI
jgi:hypothetical protein